MSAHEMLWGKSPKRWTRLGDGGRQHLLTHHLTDTALVGGELWDRYVTPRFRSEFERYSGADNPRGFFMLCCALHDIGKAMPDFQLQVPELFPDTMSNTPIGNRNHEMVGAGLCHSLFEPMTADMDPMTPVLWSLMLNVDNGSFLSARDVFDPCLPSDWAAAVDDIINQLREFTGCDAPMALRLPPGQFAIQLAGHVKTADWIASNEESFTWVNTPMPMSTYAADAAARARAGLTDAAIARWRITQPEHDFITMFPGWFPRPMQQVVEASAKGAVEPTLIIIEDEMGTGKTEAALTAAYHYANNGLASGVYFALPTMVTANRIHERATSWLEGSGLAPEGDQRAIRLAHSSWEDIFPDETRYWTRGRRRAMLSRLGVGTVDQVLAAVVHAKYHQTRIAGLAGRVVIFDEVHAYDVYMSKLFTEALRWLAAMGCPVVLLSATIAPAQRQEMVDAYRSGLAGHDIREPLTEGGYPCVTVASDNGVEVHVGQMVHHHTVKVEHLAWEDVAIRLRRTITSQFGRVAVVCNTVNDALSAAASIRKAFPDARVVVDHSRFVPTDRKARDDEVEQVAGKGRSRSGLTFVVATQVIEQSLDVDFDLMVTQMAPIDLIIQRLGRLWRHKNRRPRWCRQPTLWLADDHGEGSWREGAFVYASNDPTALMQTHLVVKGMTEMSIPEDIPSLVAQVYDRESPARVPDELSHDWDAAVSQSHGVWWSHTNAADTHRLGSPWGDSWWQPTSVEAKTRFNDYSVDVVVPCENPGDNPDMSDIRAWKKRVISVPKSMLKKMSHCSPPEWNAEHGPDGRRTPPFLRDIPLVDTGADSPACYDERLGLRIEDSI